MAVRALLSHARFVPYFGEDDNLGVDLTAYSKVYRGHVQQSLDNEADELVRKRVRRAVTVCLGDVAHALMFYVSGPLSVQYQQTCFEGFGHGSMHF